MERKPDQATMIESLRTSIISGFSGSQNIQVAKAERGFEIRISKALG